MERDRRANGQTSSRHHRRFSRPDEIKRVTDVTYLGVVYGTMTALQRMLLRDYGTIVQVGSALAYRGIPLQAAYCGAKHVLIARKTLRGSRWRSQRRSHSTSPTRQSFPSISGRSTRVLVLVSHRCHRDIRDGASGHSGSARRHACRDGTKGTVAQSPTGLARHHVSVWRSSRSRCSSCTTAR
jgi:hypothetical protein